MKKRLLLVTMLVAMFGNINVSAIVVNPNGGEFAAPSQADNFTANWTFSSTIGEGNFLLTDITDAAKVQVMYPGYTFLGWDDYVTNYQRDFPVGVLAGNQPITVSMANHKVEEYMVNVWIYLNSQGDVPTGTIVGCTSKGWKLENPSSGNITFSVYTTYGSQTGYQSVDLDKQWSVLESGWHMLTFVYWKEAANKYWGFTCLDGAGSHPLGDDNSSTMYNRLTHGIFTTPTTFDAAENLQIGNTAFSGKISGVSIIHRHYQRFDNKENFDTMLKQLYENGKPDVATPKTYAAQDIKAMFKANTATTITVEKNDGTEDTNTTDAIKSGIATNITEPTRADHVFSHWSNTAKDYINRYQDIPCIQYKEGTPSNSNLKDQFSRPYDGGASNVVTFDTNNYLAIADQSYKYTDCFTMHMRAWMKNWEDFKTSAMRLISCTAGGGWNIEPTYGDTKLVTFAGFDDGLNDYCNANTKVEWASLNDSGVSETFDGQEGKWHSFTYVFTGRYIHAYIDGQLKATSDAFKGKMRYNSKNYIFIGAEADGDAGAIESGHNFNGKMQNFCLMPVALTPSQVKDLHNYKDAEFCYHAPSNTTLTANWIALDALQADAIASNEFFLNEGEYNQTIAISGNSKIVPTVEYTGEGGWSKTSQTVNSTTAGNSVSIKYVPSTIGTHKVSVKVTSKYSTTKEVTATNKTYRRFAYSDDGLEETKHVWKGETVSHDLEVIGDGYTKPSLDFTGESPFSFEYTKALDKDGGKAHFEFTPTEVGTHTAKLYINSNSTMKERRNDFSETHTLNYHAHEFDVAYWQEDGFLVRADAELAGTTITLTDENKHTVTFEKTPHTDNAADTYFFQRKDQDNQTKDLGDLENKMVHATFTGEGWSLEKDIYIPRIVDTDEEATTTGATVQNDKFDVVVTEGRTLTHTEGAGEHTINNLYVQSGAKFAIDDASSSADTYTTHSVILYSEGDDVPHLIQPNGKGTMHIKSDSIYFVKRIPYDRYYEICLPFDCNVEDIRIMDGMSMNGREWADGPSQREIDWEVMYYDGQSRIGNEGYSSNWKVVTEQTLKAGQGYLVAIDAPDGKTKRELVFPMKVGNTNLSNTDNAEKTVSVTAYGSTSSVGNNHKGWNFVGNPYFTTYGYNNGDVSVIKPGAVILNQWQGTGIYLTIANKEDGGQTYTQKLYTEKDATLPPFSAFFIQVGADTDGNENRTLTFSPNSRQPQDIAPRKASESSTQQPVYVGVTLSNGTLKDETSLVIGSQFTQAYEIGSDLEKMLGLGVRPQVYVTDANYQYAFKSLQQADAAQPNALGVYLPAQGEYTFAIKESYDLSQVQALYLTDKEKNVTVNLLQTPYTFSGSKTHTKTRFSISTVLSADVATSLSNTAASWAVWQNGELSIRVQGLTVGDAIRIFDSMGRLVGQGVAKDTAADFEVPTTGTYCIQTIGEAGSCTKKLLVVGF